MILISHHRTEALAERKRRVLARLYTSVELLSRRNARGRYSASGRTYVWEVQLRKKKKARAEFIVHFDYGQLSKNKGDQRIRFQVHVFGPTEATLDDAIKAIRTRNQGDPWPRGWSKKAIYWSKPRPLPESHKKRTDPLPPSLRHAAIAAGRATPISKNLPSRGKRK